MNPTRLNRPGFWPGRSAVRTQYVLTGTPHPAATCAALDVLKQNGSAADAALAAYFTLAVVEPLHASIGGDLHGLSWSASENKAHALIGAGICPEKLSWRTFARGGQGFIPQRGWKSVGVPGALRAAELLHQKQGRLKWAQLFESAQHAATQGAAMQEISTGQYANLSPILQNDVARTAFYPGTKFFQPELAKTLKQVAEQGPDAFYRGEIAREIQAWSDAEQGTFGAKDLESVKAEWLEPLKTSFLGREVVSLPGPSHAVAGLLALRALEAWGVQGSREQWDAQTHLTLEALKWSMQEADLRLGDYEKAREWTHAVLAQPVPNAGEQLKHANARSGDWLTYAQGGSASIVVADASGNVVLLSSNMGSAWGSGLIAGKTGVLLNNTAHGFTPREDHPNVLLPGRRALFTNSPYFVFEQGNLTLGTACTTSAYPIQAQTQVLLNIFQQNMSLTEAVAAPRFLYKTGTSVQFETDFPEEVIAGVLGQGHHSIGNERGPIGLAQILGKEKVGGWAGSEDPRGDGVMLGW